MILFRAETERDRGRKRERERERERDGEREGVSECKRGRVCGRGVDDSQLGTERGVDSTLPFSVSVRFVFK